jgi:hypothetical protein
MSGKTEMSLMPTDPILKERWRAHGLLRWLKASFPEHLPIFTAEVEKELGELLKAKTYDDYKFSKSSVTLERFLVLMLVEKADGSAMEEFNWKSVSQMEEANMLVGKHTRCGSGRDIRHRTCRVFDTNLQRELPWHEVRRIEWGDPD